MASSSSSSAAWCFGPRGRASSTRLGESCRGQRHAAAGHRSEPLVGTAGDGADPHRVTAPFRRKPGDAPGWPHSRRGVGPCVRGPPRSGRPRTTSRQRVRRRSERGPPRCGRRRETASGADSIEGKPRASATRAEAGKPRDPPIADDRCTRPVSHHTNVIADRDPAPHRQPCTGLFAHTRHGRPKVPWPIRHRSRLLNGRPRPIGRRAAKAHVTRPYQQQRRSRRHVPQAADRRVGGPTQQAAHTALEQVRQRRRLQDQPCCPGGRQESGEDRQNDRLSRFRHGAGCATGRSP